MLNIILYLYLIPCFISIIFIRKFKWEIYKDFIKNKGDKNIDFNKIIFLLPLIPILNIYFGYTILIEFIIFIFKD
jgi:hypothetical protein